MNKPLTFALLAASIAAAACAGRSNTADSQSAPRPPAPAASPSAPEPTTSGNTGPSTSNMGTPSASADSGTQVAQANTGGTGMSSTDRAPRADRN